ncbi:uncharacterized protein LOC126381979 isoform X2 [Pectinophora gossypiella]|uniref:uncharacterized protein LOC126381979 isoform X2 n=1 Tax=Pectinophora gossypiella TaxID=13191 RepID=UPI00214E8D13|nr:uncharacterized protein LOC126381979 isoform X2 [Pectinophora gossypiella]
MVHTVSDRNEMKCCTSVVFAVLLTLVRGQAQDAEQACMTAFQPENMKKFCCADTRDVDVDSIKLNDQCGMMTTKLWTCEISECLLTKQGLIKDGEMNLKMTSDILQAIVRQMPDLKPMVDNVINKCVKGKYENLFPGITCEAMKYHACLFLTSAMVSVKFKLFIIVNLRATLLSV